MTCPRCGIYNPYGSQKCGECGHEFVPKPIDLSDNEEQAALERRSQPYYYTAKPDDSEPKPETAISAAFSAIRETTAEVGAKSKGVIEYVSAFAAFLFRELKKNKTAVRIILAVIGIIIVVLLGMTISCTSSCIAERQRRLAEEAAAAAAAASAADVDPTPSITSMSDVWVLNQYETKLTLRRDGNFTDTSDFSTGSGTWSFDADKIYLVYSDGTLKNYTYKLLGDYLFLDWEIMELTRVCNESEAVEQAGLWISGNGYALALHEDNTHGAGDEALGKYANAWAYENGVLGMVTIRNNVEYFDYYGCEINGDTMTRLSGTVYIRENGGLELGGGDIEFSTGYDPDA